MLKVAVTHDVDRIKKTYQYFTRLLRGIKTTNIKQITYHISSLFSKKEPYWNFEDLYEIENKFNIKSTFFFLHETIPFNPFSISNWPLSLGRYDIEDEKVKKIIRELDRNHWEIGLHGSYNSFRNYKSLIEEKNKLEGIVNHPIKGIRQHHLNLSDETWKIQKKAGFKYDTSWGFNDRIGFKDDKYIPFRPFDDEFTVFPMVIMDKPFAKAKNKWSLLEKIIETSILNHSILIINWHLDTFNDQEFPTHRTDFIKILNILKEHNAEFETLGNFYNSL